jgi:hypothetical protein
MKWEVVEYEDGRMALIMEDWLHGKDRKAIIYHPDDPDIYEVHWLEDGSEDRTPIENLAQWIFDVHQAQLEAQRSYHNQA